MIAGLLNIETYLKLQILQAHVALSRKIMGTILKNNHLKINA